MRRRRVIGEEGNGRRVVGMAVVGGCIMEVEGTEAGGAGGIRMWLCGFRSTPGRILDGDPMAAARMTHSQQSSYPTSIPIRVAEARTQDLACTLLAPLL